MLNGQVNVTELSRGTQAPLLLLKLMGDLAALDQELQTAEDRTGQPVSTYQDAFAERLCRVGVSDQKIDDFSRWQQTISSLIADNSGDEDQLAKIIAAETAGLAVFADLIAVLKGSEHYSLSKVIAA
jgi:hypothetical protein